MSAGHPSVNRIIFDRLIAHHRLSSTLSSSFRKPTFYLVTPSGILRTCDSINKQSFTTVSIWRAESQASYLSPFGRSPADFRISKLDFLIAGWNHQSACVSPGYVSGRSSCSLMQEKIESEESSRRARLVMWHDASEHHELRWIAR